MDDELHLTAAYRLRRESQRYTRARRALVELLAAERRPMTTADIHRAGSGLPLSSLYRNLAVLTQAGVVHRMHGTNDSSLFELAEDLTEHHHHLVCLECGSVEDVTLPAATERDLTKALTAATAATGFVSEGHRLDVVGRCIRCRATT